MKLLIVLILPFILMSCSGDIDTPSTKPETPVAQPEEPPVDQTPSEDTTGKRMIWFSDFLVDLVSDEACTGFLDSTGNPIAFPFEGVWNDPDEDGLLDPSDYGLSAIRTPLASLGYMFSEGVLFLDPDILSDNASSLLSGNPLEELDTLLKENIPRIEYLMLPDSVEAVGDDVFNSIMNIYMAFVTETVYKDFLNTIGETGLFVLNGTRELVLPSSLEHVTPIWRLSEGMRLFSMPSGLDAVVSDEGCRYTVRKGGAYDSSDGWLLAEDGKRLIAGPDGDILTIPDGVRTIGVLSMMSKGVKILDLNDVENVENYAFAGCHLLRCLSTGNVRSLSTGAFLGAYSLEDLLMEEGLETIGDRAFLSAYSLSDINIPASVRYIGDDAFAGWAELGDCPDPDGVTNYVERKVTFATGSSLEGFGGLPFQMTPVTYISLSSDFLAQFWQPLFRWLEKPNEVEADGLVVEFADGVTRISRLPESADVMILTRTSYEDNFEALTDILIGESVETIDDDAFMVLYNSASWKNSTGSSPGVDCTIHVNGDMTRFNLEAFPWTDGRSHGKMDISIGGSL